MTARRDEMVAAQYLTAIAGSAALRRCVTEPSAVRARLDEVRHVVEHRDEFPYDLVIPVFEHPIDEGYDLWAERYDGVNPALEADTATVHPLLAALPVGTALDAACGTGRHSAFLAGKGFEVIGVDGNERMLDVARAKVPGGDFRRGDLYDLPVDDASVDLAVCSLALSHVERLAPAVDELARVVRPGGTVVLSDIHPQFVTTSGGAATFPTGTEDLELHFVRDLLHPVSEYVAAALGAGLTIRDCREADVPESVVLANPAYPLVPDAVRQAFEDLPFLLVWRLERPR